MKLSNSFSGALRTFSYWMASRTVGQPLLEGVDYLSLFGKEPSAIEKAYAIFANVLEMDGDGKVLNGLEIPKSNPVSAKTPLKKFESIICRREVK